MARSHRGRIQERESCHVLEDVKWPWLDTYNAIS
jgi:hypothetical protein